MTSQRTPTVRGRRLGLDLRKLRQTAGMTIEMVAEQMRCSTSKISRIETGHTGVTPRDIRRMGTLYGLAADQIEDLVKVSKEARQKGWWHLYGEVLTGAYVGLEQAASSIRAYEAQVVSGLLQTEQYAHAMIKAARHDIGPAELERRLRVRMTRQSLLTKDNPLYLWVVLDEAVLRRPIGSREVMYEQLEHLLTVSELSNVALQVLPFAAGAHAGMDGSFLILGYPESTTLDVAFAQNAAGGLFLEKEDEIQRYGFIFDHLRAKALGPEESRAFIAEVAKEL